MKQCYFFVVLIILNPPPISGQSLPVGTPILEDNYRRTQLLYNTDSLVSFTIRPIFPSACFKQKQSLYQFSSEEKENGNNFIGSYRFGQNKGQVQLLPFTWKQQYNTHHPYSLNDGAMIPARGYQTIVSGGLFAKYGILSIQLQPEYIYAKNRDYQGFYNEQSDPVWAGYYNSVLNNIYLPEKFGEVHYNQLLWGQSSIRITKGAVSLGLSNENLWWGPGMRNSLIMTNTASGFLHITLNTVKPIKTFLGSLEGQIIGGRLENSGFAPPDTNRIYNGVKLYSPERDDWRYVNAFVFTFQPKLIPGFFAGLTRSFIRYGNDTGNGYRDYLPILAPFTKKANYGENETIISEDQRLSVFIRFLLPKEKAEFYWEFGREDHAFNLRDILVQPDHTRAYIIGFRKLLPVKKSKDQYISINLELTQLSLTSTNPERPQGSFYLHYGLRQGYTHRGQLLGAGIGPGSNMQMLNISWTKSLKTLGIQIERYVHNNDFQVTDIKDIRSNWVDFTTAAIGELDYKNFLLSLKFEVIRSYNYQYLYWPLLTNPPFFWNPGQDVYNYQANIGVSYRF